MSSYTPMPAPAQKPGTRRLPAEAAKPRTTAVSSRRMLGQFLLFSAVMALVVVLLTIVVDPLQFYHKATWYSPIYSTEQRYQNPGLAKHYDYDTVIIGTSMTDNFLPSEVNRALGGKTIKLSIEGSTADEHYKTARLALKTGKVKTVLWGLDYFSLKTADADPASPFPDYLYDDVWWNDYKYWFNFTTYQQFFKGIARQLLGSAPQDIEYLYNWNKSSVFGKKRVLDDYNKAQVAEAYFGLNEEPLDVIEKSFNDNILSLVDEYPDVQFIFYYPPYTVLRQILWANTNEQRFDNQLDMKTWMYEQFGKHPNVRVYDFQSETNWTYDLDLYKDLSHHSQDVNSQIIAAIGRDDANYRVTAQNVASFGAELKLQIEETALTPEGDPLKTEIVIDGSGEPERLFSKIAIPVDGELYVPAKEAAAALGATLAWNQADKTLTMGRKGRGVAMKADNGEADVNGSKVTMTAPIRLKGNVTTVPLIFVAEQLGWHVTKRQPDKATARYELSAG